jgi:acylphosphatase
VHGVWYRATIKKAADKLGIKGYAKNLSDGRVEVMANLEDSQLEEFKKILKKGSVASNVKEVLSESVDNAKFDDFTTK